MGASLLGSRLPTACLGSVFLIPTRSLQPSDEAVLPGRSQLSWSADSATSNPISYRHRPQPQT